MRISERYTIEQIKGIQSDEFPIGWDRELALLEADAYKMGRFCGRFKGFLEANLNEQDSDKLAWQEYMKLQAEADYIQKQIAEVGEASVNDWVEICTYTEPDVSANKQRLHTIRERQAELFESANAWQKFTNHGKGLC